jgi:pilus assembly protein CpaB
MSLRTVLIIVLALISGGSAAIGISNLTRQEVRPPPEETVDVVVAASDIPRGNSVAGDQLVVKKYPRELAPAGAISRLEDAVDRTASVPLSTGDPVLERKLASRSAGRGLAPLIPNGMRACTITASVSSAVAGLVLPGNRVDVLLSLSRRGGDNDPTGGASTLTLLQNIEILAIDQHLDAPADNKIDPNLRSVTLLVMPYQAAKLELGQGQGTLHLTLRNPRDDKTAASRPATLAEIDPRKIPGPTWEERLKTLLQAIAGNSLRPRPSPGITFVAEPDRIRTIRGTAEGFVFLGKEAHAASVAQRSRNKP